ncbi:MAG: hypothetical protein Q7T82_10545, partial [Armatimonadota bacterium]|nr:hypothetical protein [Armatimonadota bacterium]
MRNIWKAICLLVMALGVFGPACAVPPGHIYWTERFNYPVNSNLNGNGGWSGSAGDEIKINPDPTSGGPYVRVTGGAGSKDSYVTTDYSGQNGVIWVHVLVWTDGGVGTSFWRLWLDDVSGNNLACWQGSALTCKGIVGGTPQFTNDYALVAYGWNDLCCKIDTNANTSEFFANQTPVGMLSHGATPGNALGRLRIERADSAPAAGDFVYFDELMAGCRVAAEPPPFYHNGEPFFPIGIYHYPGDSDANHLQELSEAGFNVVRRWIGSLTPADLDTAQSYGITVLADSGGWLGDTPTYGAALQSKVDEIKNHPALIGYETMDEPYWNWVRFGNGYSREALTTGRDLVNQLDPNRSVWCNYAPYDLTSMDGVIPLTFEGYREWTSVGNIYAMDRYPVWYGWDDLNSVNYVCDVVKEIAGEGKTIYMVLQGCAMFDWETDPTPWARPNFTQTRFMGYSSIIHGANGILYWGQYYIEPTSQLWTDLKRFAGELNYLKDVLSKGATSTSFTVGASGCEAIMKAHNGDRYLIVSNRTAAAKTGVSIQVPGWGSSFTRVLFEDRTVSSPAASFTDDFQPWDVHVYTDQLSPDDPPGAVSAMTASSCGDSITLNWTNPIDKDFDGTMIRCKPGSFPTGPTDGALVVDKPGAPGLQDTFTHSGLADGVVYYAAFAHDAVPHYSAAAQVAAVVGPAVDETFDNYLEGDLGGSGTWITTGAASATVQSAFVKGAGGKAALMDCIASGGSPVANEISFPDRTGGYHYVTMDVAQDAAGSLGQEIAGISFRGAGSEIAELHIQNGRLFLEYGSGTYAVLTTAAANQTWYNIRIGFNVDTKRIDAWLDGAQKVSGYAWKTGPTKISSIVISSNRNTNLNPQKAYLDNLKLDIRPGTVAEVRDDGEWIPSLSKLHFTFDPIPCAAEYRYAMGSSPTSTNIRNWTICGSAADVLATGLYLADNQTLYIQVQAGTGHDTWGLSRASNGIKVAPGVTIPAAKALDDGGTADTKAIRGDVVSAVFPGFFYIQDSGHRAIRILSSASVAAGDEVDVCGVMKGSEAERYVDATGCGIIKTTPGPGLPGAVVLPNASLGGAALNSYTPGVTGGMGPNNIGLYVTAYGAVTQRQTTDPKYCYIDDGSGLKDGTTTGGAENVGIRVIADPASYPEGCYVAVEGISSCFDSGGL